MKKEFTIGKHSTEPSIEPQEDMTNSASASALASGGSRWQRKNERRTS